MKEPSTWVLNRFGGMRDLSFFGGDIRNWSRKQGRVGAGLCFFRVGMQDWQGKQNGIRDFNSSVTSP